MQLQTLKKWTRPSCYIGAEWPDFYSFLGQSRDSDALERANFGACKMPNPHPLTFGSPMCHQLFLGNAVFRPRLVCETNKLKGYGLTGIATSGAMGNPDEWERIIILDGMPI